ncbi:MAG: pentapeptide repeat-containing protein [Aulosira sp. DedQUE10]|nr:pentapeptide repeat-containing protein [Aulosira sp. DedQUE10]
MDADELLRRYAAGERDFTGIDFSKVDFSEGELSGSDLSGINQSKQIDV